jgi:hypothetical protein
MAAITSNYFALPRADDLPQGGKTMAQISLEAAEQK